MPRDKLQPALLRRSKKAALIAITYLTLLVVPWILTCVLAGKTIRQSRDNSGALSPADAASRHQLAYLIDVLNLMAALAALPTMYALLARAAVVFSQRTDLKKTLNVKQLFALADRRFLTLRHSGSKMDKGGTSLAAVGAVLIVLALIFPPIRAVLVHTEIKLFPEAAPTQRQSSITPDWVLPNGWVASYVGMDPMISQLIKVDQRLAVEKTRHALISTLPIEWRARAWNDPHGGEDHPYFASAVPRDTTTGLFRQHALRMNSSAWCNSVAWAEFPESCAGRERPYRLETTYDNANLTVKVCMPEPVSSLAGGEPWSPTGRDGYRQELSETLWINVMSPLDPGGDRRMYNRSTLKCTANTTLGYFELGNHFNGGQPGSLLSQLSNPPNQYYQDKGEFTDAIHSYFFLNPRDTFWINDYGADEKNRNQTFPSPVATGPLSIVAHALFGEDSFFDLAQSITTPNDTLSNALCRLSPIPFQRVYPSLIRCEPQLQSDSRVTASAGQYASPHGWANDRVYALIELMAQDNKTAKLIDSVLDTGLYLAGQAVLDAAAVPYGESPNQIWRAEGLAVRTPVVSLPAMIVVSVLMGLQVVGLLLLLFYIYKVPTWTETLDAVALARFVGQ